MIEISKILQNYRKDIEALKKLNKIVNELKTINKELQLDIAKSASSEVIFGLERMIDRAIHEMAKNIFSYTIERLEEVIRQNLRDENGRNL